MSSSQTSGHLARLGITPIVQTLTSVVAWNGSCSPAEPRSRPRAGNHQDKGVSSCLSRSESQSRLCLRSASLLRPPLHLGFIRAAQSRPIDRLVQHPEVSSTATRLDQAFFSPPAHGNKVTRIATTQTDPSRRRALRNGMKGTAPNCGVYRASEKNRPSEVRRCSRADEGKARRNTAQKTQHLNLSA